MSPSPVHWSSIPPLHRQSMQVSINAEIIKSTDSGENWVTIKAGLPFALFNTSGSAGYRSPNSVHTVRGLLCRV